METGYKMTFTTMETDTKTKFSGKNDSYRVKMTFTSIDPDTKSHVAVNKCHLQLWKLAQKSTFAAMETGKNDIYTYGNWYKNTIYRHGNWHKMTFTRYGNWHINR